MNIRNSRNDDTTDDRSRRGIAPLGIALKWWIVGGIVGVVLFVCCGAGIAALQIPGNTSTGNDKEATLSSVYSDGANYFSSCIVQTNQAANVATANADAFDKVIKDAMGGTGEAGQFNLSTPSGQAGFFPLLVKAYPAMEGQTDLYKKVLDVMVSCQTEFSKKQSNILDRVRDFNKWRTNFWTSKLGGGSFPNENLYIGVSGVPRSTGMAALTTMESPIVTSDTANAYKSGTYTPTNPFGTPNPNPSK